MQTHTVRAQIDVQYLAFSPNQISPYIMTDSNMVEQLQTNTGASKNPLARVHAIHLL